MEVRRSDTEIEEDAFQADRDAQVPKVWEIGLCRRGEASWWTQVAYWVLQVLHVQQGLSHCHVVEKERQEKGEKRERR